jgi:hypothetical protein
MYSSCNLEPAYPHRLRWGIQFIMKSILCKILLAVCGCGAVFGISIMPIFNQPSTLVSQSYGTVVGGEFYPGNKWDAQRLPMVRVRTDSGRELLFGQVFSYQPKYGERVVINVWKRTLFGYKTTYEKVELSQSN